MDEDDPDEELWKRVQNITLPTRRTNNNNAQAIQFVQESLKPHDKFPLLPSIPELSINEASDLMLQFQELVSIENKESVTVTTSSSTTSSSLDASLDKYALFHFIRVLFESNRSVSLSCGLLR
jgi:hypothetical protein